MYQYVELPAPFRVQVVHILRDVLGHRQHPVAYEATKYYGRIHDILARELGVFRLHTGAVDPEDGVCQFFLRTDDVEEALSVIEVSLRVARTTEKHHDTWYRLNLNMTVDEAIVELNARFLEHGIGYQFESNEIVRIDSNFLHQETVRPALHTLREKHYAGANEEFRKAHQHYRHQRYAETVNECLKALESTLKVICEKRRWPVPDTATVKTLLHVVFEQELVPSYLQSKFAGLRAVMESGVPAIRNREGGHGAGAQPRNIPQHLAAYVLHLTASAIVFLSQCDAELKRNG